LIPVLDGKGMIDFSKRLNWGGSQAAEYLLKLVQLKYPAFPTRLTLSQAAWMQESLLYVQGGEHESYEEFIGRMSDPDELAKEDQVLQYPFTVETKEEKTQEEIEALLEKRRENGRRLQEQAQKTRLEKMVQKENDLKYYEQLKEWKAKERKAEYFKRLESEGFNSEGELDSTIRKLQVVLKKSRAKTLGDEEEQAASEAPSFALVDTPDDQLDEEGIREKRKQRLMKAGYEARLRAKVEKEEEKRLIELQIQKEDEERINDPRGWAAKKRKEYDETIQRIKERKRRKAMLNDRKSLATQQRMKNITSLASDAPTGPTKRKKRGGDEDTFGADDDDWAIYREIRNDEDSDVSEEEMTTLSTLEERLLRHDATFTANDTYDSQLRRKNKLTSTFLRGYYPEWNVEDMAQQHQIHLNIERSKVPEVLWKPYLAGTDQAGIDEVASFILGNFDVDKRGRLMNVRESIR
jgi:actin-related protein 5